MAKKQKKVPQLRYNKQQYERYRKALELLGEDVKKLKRPTRKSVEKIRRQYTKVRTTYKKQNYDIPTLNELVRIYDTPPLPTSSQTDTEYVASEEEISEATATQELDKLIDRIQAEINSVSSKTIDTGREPTIKEIRKLNDARYKFFSSINFMRNKLGDIEALKLLMENDLGGRVEQVAYSTLYMYEVTDALTGDGGLLDLVQAMTDSALANL